MSSGPGSQHIPEDYRIFLEVVECGSMSKASWSLGLDVSIISRNIAALERRFSAVLFERHARGVRLTKAGTVVEEFVHSVVDKELSVRQKLDSLNQMKGASLKVACTSAAISGPLSGVLNQFSVKYSDVLVEVLHMPARLIVPAVADGRVDVGVGFNLEQAPGIDIVKIYEDVIAAVVPNEHPLSKLSSVSRKQLVDYPIGAFEYTSVKGEMVRRFLEEGEDGLRPHLLTNSMDALKQYTRDRTGVSIFCRSAMWHEITEGKMTAVPLSGVSPVRQEICSRRASTNNRIIEAFRDEIANTPPFKIAV
jgi:DNA-binding transcriptional LysR family regulator